MHSFLCTIFRCELQRTSTISKYHSRVKATTFYSSNDSGTEPCIQKAVPFKSISDPGRSIIHQSTSCGSSVANPAHSVMNRNVVGAKLLSLTSSFMGLIMAPIFSKYLWEAAVEQPIVMTFTVAVNSIFILLSLTPFLLHFLVKRFVVDIFYDEKSKIFTAVHYGLFLNKKALRFRKEDVIDVQVALKKMNVKFPLATAFVHGQPLLLSLNVNSYTDQRIFYELTKNIKILPNSD